MLMKWKSLILRSRSALTLSFHFPVWQAIIISRKTSESSVIEREENLLKLLFVEANSEYVLSSASFVCDFSFLSYFHEKEN